MKFVVILTVFVCLEVSPAMSSAMFDLQEQTSGNRCHARIARQRISVCMYRYACMHVCMYVCMYDVCMCLVCVTVQTVLFLLPQL